MARLIPEVKPRTILSPRWRVRLIRRDSGRMEQFLKAERLTKLAARRAMRRVYKAECLDYPPGWRLIGRTRQADRCELRFKQENGKLARREIIIQRA